MFNKKLNIFNYCENLSIKDNKNDIIVISFLEVPVVHYYSCTVSQELEQPLNLPWNECDFDEC